MISKYLYSKIKIFLIANIDKSSTSIFFITNINNHKYKQVVAITITWSIRKKDSAYPATQLQPQLITSPVSL